MLLYAYFLEATCHNTFEHPCFFPSALTVLRKQVWLRVILD